MKIKLTWKDNATTETEQRIYVSGDIASASRVLAGTVAADVTEATIDVPAEFVGKQFYVTVVAVEGEKASEAKSFYVTKDGLLHPADFHSRARALTAFHKDVKPVAVAHRFELGEDHDFLSPSAVVGELASGKIMNQYGSNFFLYDPVTLERTTFTTAYSSAYSQAKGVFSPEGKWSGVFQRKAEPEILSFDGVTETILGELPASMSGQYVGFVRPDGDVVHIDMSYGKLKVAHIDKNEQLHLIDREMPEITSRPIGVAGNFCVTEKGKLIITELDSDVPCIRLYSVDLMNDYALTVKEIPGMFSVKAPNCLCHGELFGFLGGAWYEETQTRIDGVMIFDTEAWTFDHIQYDDFAASYGCLSAHGEWIFALGGADGASIIAVDPVAKSLRTEHLGGTGNEWGLNNAFRGSKGVYLTDSFKVAYRVEFKLNDVAIDPSQMRSDICQGRGR